MAHHERRSVLAEPLDEFGEGLAKASCHFRHAFPAAECDVIAVEQPPQVAGVPCFDLGVAQALPFAHVWLTPAHIHIERDTERARRVDGSVEIRGDHGVETPAFETLGQPGRLVAASLVERCVARTLPASLGVERRLGVSNEGDLDWHGVPERLGGRRARAPRLEACSAPSATPPPHAAT